MNISQINLKAIMKAQKKLVTPTDLFKWWGQRDLNPHGVLAPPDFKSDASTNSAMSPRSGGSYRT